MAVVIGPDGPVADRLLDDSEAAALLKVSKGMIAKARRAGDLETVHIGRAARVRMSDIQRVIRDGGL